jgi:hypothetical protein
MLKEIAKSALQPVLSTLRPGNVAMFHIGRCGSTVLSSLLSQHHKIFWASEFYVRYFREWEKANGGQEVIGQMPGDAIQLLQDHMKLALHRYFGFEIKPFHFKLIGYDMDSFIQHLDKMGYTHFILLDRENRLRKIISSVIAHQDRKKYHQNEKVKAKKKQVYIDVDRVAIDYQVKPLISFLSDYEEEIAALKIIFKSRKHLSLTYEKDIQNDPVKAYQQVCDFLGIKSRNVTVELSRTNPFVANEMIENFDEVESVLKGTNYEWMLYE